MEIQSPIKNGLLRLATYGGIALAVAAKSPELGYFLTSSTLNSVKSAARTAYTNNIVLKSLSKNEVKNIANA